MQVYSFPKAVARTVAKETGSDSDFKVGKTLLVAMKKQFEDNNKANIYKTDGIIKLHKLKQIKVLLLETSSHFGSDDGVKSSFDHHRGLFGVLAMLKTIADEFCLGSEKVFSKLELFFVHASGRSIYL
ncbi:hypothetical protein BDF14DRAFT_1739952 [Spinellus fusiger]|nr:hypothetical protein BDF14DRAFT_1739952 [Spinellus fusiger]